MAGPCIDSQPYDAPPVEVKGSFHLIKSAQQTVAQLTVAQEPAAAYTKATELFMKT